MNDKQANKEAARLIAEYTNQGAKRAHDKKLEAEVEAAEKRSPNVVVEALEPLAARVTRMESANADAEVQRLIREHGPRRVKKPEAGSDDDLLHGDIRGG